MSETLWKTAGSRGSRLFPRKTRFVSSLKGTAVGEYTRRAAPGSGLQ